MANSQGSICRKSPSHYCRLSREDRTSSLFREVVFASGVFAAPAGQAMAFTRRLLLLLVLGLATPALSYPAQLSTAQVQTLQNYIVAKIDSTAVTNPDGTVRRPLIPAFVRLAFHDCCGTTTGCDGCVNLGLADNNGLKPAVDNLELLYKDTTLGISTLLSRADFWALAGLTAANYGARLQRPPPNAPPGTQPYIPASLVPVTAFKTGRKDCAGAPKGTETSGFPDGLKGQTETFAFFTKFFGFTTAETVAILGAHTLGRAVVQDSGFAGPWVPADNVLDNQYFRTLSDTTLPWAQATAPGTGGKIQWQRPAPGPPPPPGTPARQFIMLNADMCLFKQLTLGSTGLSSCTFSGTKACPLNAASAPTVQQYATSNTKWLDDFGAVFNKMQNICKRTCTTSTCTRTPCTLATLKSAQAAAVQAEAEGQVAEPVPLDVSLATAQAAAAQPENVAAEVQPVPVAVEGATGVAVEGAAGVTADAAVVSTATAPEVPAVPGAEQQAVPAAVRDAQAIGGKKRRAARKLT